MVDDTRWRADTRGSSSSVEASVSSLTNGTHSSLNTEMEEDELAYSIEHSMQCNTYMHLKGHECGKVEQFSRALNLLFVKDLCVFSLFRTS